MKKVWRSFVLAVSLVLLCTLIPAPAHAAISNSGSFNVAGLAISDDSSTSITWNVDSANAISVATGSFNSATKSGTLTFTNTSDSEAVLSFDLAYYLKAGGNNAQSYIAINGTNYVITDKAGRLSTKEKGSSKLDNATTLTYTVAAGKTVTLKVSATGGTLAPGQASLAITNITVKIKSTANVTFAPDSAVSYTVDYVDGDGVAQTAAVAAGGSNVTVEAELSEGFAITPSSGYVCEGAVGSASGVVYANGLGEYTFAKNETVTPVFLADSGSKPWKHLGTGKEYYNLNAAANGGSGTVVLQYDYTLPAGDYTIPYGVTLLIPCDDANTVYTTKPGDDGTDMYKETSVYRKLTMADGANITVNGAISIGGKIATNQTGQVVDTKYYLTNGAPSGPLGYIDMDEGSSITVNSGANLYAWGFVTGSGAVTIKNGGGVYENFQIRDWRGGNCTSSIKDNASSRWVFPFSQYYIQNIEVPLTLEAGATETVCTAMSITLVGVVKENAVFIGSGSGLIRLTSGSLTRTYDGSADRVIYDLDGEISFANLNISIQTGLFGSVTINSKDYVMPLNGNMTMNMNDGSKVAVNQDFALLPGSIVNIAEGATCALGSGNRMYVYDKDQWGGYCSQFSYKFNSVYYAPGRTYTRTEADLVDAKVIVNGTFDAANGALYTTASGANIASDGGGTVKTAKGAETVTYQITQSGSDIGAWNEISITPAKLKNADSSYIQSGTDIYTYTNGVWTCTDHSYDSGVVSSAATCTATGVKTYTCVACRNTKTETIDALGHTAGAAVKENVVAPTCTADGSHDEVVYCTVCKAELSRTTVTDAATGHTNGDPVVENEKDANCGTAGSYESVVYCTVCNAELSRETVTVPATGNHTAGNPVVENNVAPDCVNDGSYDNVVYCTVCKGELSRETVTVDALGHTEVTDAAVAPTCTATGLTEGKHCSVCEAVLIAQNQVSAKGHAWSNDCDTDCNNGCGETRPAAHAWDDGVVTQAPTATIPGEKIYTCGTCGETKTETVPAIGVPGVEFVYSGNCGVNGSAYVKWGLTADGVMYIYGTGAMENYKHPTTKPTKVPGWDTHKLEINRVVVMDGVTYVGEYAFYDCDNLTSVDLAESMTSMGMYAFAGTGLTSVDLPDAMTEIPAAAFYLCYYLDTVELPANLETIGMSAFYQTGLTSVVLPDNVTNIGYDAFTNCFSLESVTLSENLKTIGDQAFKSCEALTSVVIPASVSSIGDEAFNFCEKLTEIVFTGNAPAIASGSFANCKATVRYPSIGIGWENVANKGYGYNSNLTWVADCSNGHKYTAEETEPTCTTAGYTTYTCVCGDSYTVTGDAALGHDWDEGVETLPPTATDDGVKTYTCGVCKETQAEVIPALGGGEPEHTHTPDEAVIENIVKASGNVKAQYDSVVYCTECQEEVSRQTVVLETNVFAGMTMNLESSLEVQVGVNTKLLQGTGYYAEFRRTYADGSADDVLVVKQADWKPYSGTVYTVPYTGMRGCDMSEEFYVIVYDGNDEVVGVYSDSIREYAMRMVVDTKKAPEYRRMFVDMLNYGAAAQSYFGYAESDLANNQLTAEHQELATGEISGTNNRVMPEPFAGNSLSLENRIMLNFMFKKAAVSEGMYAEVKYTTFYGVEKSVSYDYSDFKHYGNAYWYISVDGISVTDGYQMIACTLYNSDGTELATMWDSMEGYLARNISKDISFPAVLKFIDSAFNYFTTK